MNGHVYAIVRTDIPIPDQIVQVGHACLEAGSKYYDPSKGTASLVVLQVPDQTTLVKWVERLTQKDVPHEVFNEPDDDMGYTALATAPLFGSQRNVFGGLKLWTEYNPIRMQDPEKERNHG